jgi:hypothetical protein
MNATTVEEPANNGVQTHNAARWRCPNVGQNKLQRHGHLIVTLDVNNV